MNSINLIEQISPNKETNAGSGIFLQTSTSSPFITQKELIIKSISVSMKNTIHFMHFCRFKFSFAGMLDQ